MLIKKVFGIVLVLVGLVGCTTPASPQPKAEKSSGKGLALELPSDHQNSDVNVHTGKMDFVVK